MFPNQWQSTSSWNMSSIHHTNNVIVLFVVKHILQHLSACSGIETYKIIIIFQNYSFSELILHVCMCVCVCMQVCITWITRSFLFGNNQDVFTSKQFKTNIGELEMSTNLPKYNACMVHITMATKCFLVITKQILLCNQAVFTGDII